MKNVDFIMKWDRFLDLEELEINLKGSDIINLVGLVGL